MSFAELAKRWVLTQHTMKIEVSENQSLRTLSFFSTLRQPRTSRHTLLAPVMCLTCKPETRPPQLDILYLRLKHFTLQDGPRSLPMLKLPANPFCLDHLISVQPETLVGGTCEDVRTSETFCMARRCERQGSQRCPARCGPSGPKHMDRSNIWDGTTEKQSVSSMQLSSRNAEADMENIYKLTFEAH